LPARRSPCGRAPAALAPAPNGAGNYTQILCANPSSEEGLAITEMPQALTNPASHPTADTATSTPPATPTATAAASSPPDNGNTGSSAAKSASTPPNDPQASNITGSLTNEAPLRGSDSVTFSATDQGPGLAYLKMLVDGETIQTQTIDSNDGHCTPVPGAGAYTWAYEVPCKTSVGGHTYELNTTPLKDGPHHIQVIIEDAAGARRASRQTQNATATPNHSCSN
jgi:hypothetical protein